MKVLKGITQNIFLNHGDIKKIMAKDKQVEAAELVQEIDSNYDNLTNWERGFIASLIDKPPKIYSDKQLEAIYKIYDDGV